MVQINAGSFGTLAKADYLGTEVAVKTFLDIKQQDVGFDVHKYIEREVNILKEVRHPNVVQFMGCTIHDNKVLVVTEYVPGGNVKEWILDHTRDLHHRMRVSIAIDVARAMAYLHAHGIIHRYGVILCELSSRAAVDENLGILKRVIPGFGLDPDEVRERAIGGEGCPEELVRIALGCADEDPNRRPVWKDVMAELKELEAGIVKEEPSHLGVFSRDPRNITHSGSMNSVGSFASIASSDANHMSSQSLHAMSGSTSLTHSMQLLSVNSGSEIRNRDSTKPPSLVITNPQDQQIGGTLTLGETPRVTTIQNSPSLSPNVDIEQQTPNLSPSSRISASGDLQTSPSTESGLNSNYSPNSPALKPTGFYPVTSSTSISTMSSAGGQGGGGDPTITGIPKDLSYSKFSSLPISFSESPISPTSSLSLLVANSGQQFGSMPSVRNSGVGNTSDLNHGEGGSKLEDVGTSHIGGSAPELSVNRENGDDVNGEPEEQRTSVDVGNGELRTELASSSQTLQTGSARNLAVEKGKAKLSEEGGDRAPGMQANRESGFAQ
ncbi:hypothetical protein HDU76_014021 [Blyttiomyces sp. JEL0837]|nr:hypothetical protein HDU76_014021 [Blyttiomyces sp. JEL0837]